MSPRKARWAALTKALSRRAATSPATSELRGSGNVLRGSGNVLRGSGNVLRGSRNVLRSRASASHKAAWIALAIGALVLLFAAIAIARPGGGNSFGGGSSPGGGGRSSGGGSGGGGGGDCGAIFEIVFFLVQLTIEYPAIGIPIDILIIGILIWAYASKSKKSQLVEWNTTSTGASAAARGYGTPYGGGYSPPRPNALRPSRQVRKQLFQTLAQADPEFSLILFEDFVYALYAAVHEARGSRRVRTLTPYLRANVLSNLESEGSGLDRVHSIVVGALRYKTTDATANKIECMLEMEANYTEVRGGSEQAYYVVERWTLARSRTARSRKPETARTIGCPNCGAPLDGMRGNTCSYCNTVIDAGALDWVVEGISVSEKNPRPPQLTGDTPEMGTGLPTVVDGDAQQRYQMLTRKDPAFSWERFTRRIALIFSEMQVSWSTLEWGRARPFVSDQLFQMLSYWIETYRRSHMRNVTERARITRIEIASVTSDRYYDAITVRVHATGLDYTITDDGKVVSGSRSRERAYTEYWTLIRGTGAATRDVSDKNCPNCGAPLQINMAGNCGVCRVKVTAGQFDWVLSRIEQDEAYG